MKLFGASISPFVRKVLAFAHEKGIDLELVAASPGSDAPDFRAASPFGKIPGFQDGDFSISDSTAIITYLEAIKPEPNLIPLDPRARARTIWFEEYADTILMGVCGKVLFHRFVAPKFLGMAGDEAVADAAEQVELPPVLAYLEKTIPASGFLVEDRITLADLAVVSPLASMALIGWKLDASAYPKTAAYLERILGRPCYAPWIAQEKAMFGAA
jgi:glutathione S-transferase